MKTLIPSAPAIVRSWHVIDAEGAVLGRIASQAAKILMGKTKPIYTPFIDTGDHVIIVNAEKVVLTGQKERDKVYRTHSGYPGGLKSTGAAKMRATRPVKMVELAVAGMLPKNKLGKHMVKKLKVYAGPKHPHAAQKPAGMAAQNYDEVIKCQR
jgi:large subunit ribosomal protein L13